MKKHLSILIITLAFIFMAGAVQAAMVTETFSGMITYAADGNLFGVATDDTVTWTTTYDISYLASDGYLVIGDSEDMALSVTVGNRTFVEIEDIFYGSGIFGAPLLQFDENENIIGIGFNVDDYDNDYRLTCYEDGFTLYSLAEDGFTSDVLLVSGTFDFAPVPLPAAAWLFGSGLLGVVGLRHRKAA
jgi:hypothetical protein